MASGILSTDLMQLRLQNSCQSTKKWRRV